jgi:uncharacterized membrane protein
MLASFLMGLVGGQRAMTPLAAVSIAAARGKLPEDDTPGFMAHPLVAVGATLLAIAELAGDKQKTAPDRIVPIGLAARFVTSAIAGAVLAPRRQRWLGAGVGGLTAVVASYPGWRARMAFIPKYGQTPSGLVEDMLVILSAAGVITMVERSGE